MKTEARCIEVVVPLALPYRLTYALPPAKAEMPSLVGKRVMVSVGHGKVYTALCVADPVPFPAKIKTKEILEVVDDFPIVRPAWLPFWEWLASYYMAMPGEVYLAAVPSALRLEAGSTLEKGDITPEPDTLSDEAFLIWEALSIQPVLTYQEVMAITGLKQPARLLSQMQAQGWVQIGMQLKEKVKPRKAVWYSIHSNIASEEDMEHAMAKLNRSPKQQEAMMLFLPYSGWFQGERHWVSSDRLKHILGSHYSVVPALLEKNILCKEARLPEGLAGESEVWPPLSAEQHKVVEACKSQLSPQKPLYLYGVTGSGKTEVYLHLSRMIIDSGKDVLWLLPEISLTTQMVERIRKRLPEDVLVYHSRLSDGERATVWQQIQRPERQRGFLILGARSALMLPLPNPGLVVIDEEHDASYKQQDPSPRYHARDAALYLGKTLDIPIVMGSATPSAEAWFHVQQGHFALLTLNQRFGESTLPEVQVIDLKREQQMGGFVPPFSAPLLKEMKETLAHKDQIILFQNRRGFSQSIQCQACGFVPECPHCDVSLTYHKLKGELQCHACGYGVGLLNRCPSCGTHAFKNMGFGTERIEEQLVSHLPEVQVDRVDLDTTRKKLALQEIFERFENRETQVLVGTQMIVKGLDFSHVSLVSILFADQLLFFPDFRASERSAQMFAQVGGRAGRRGQKSKVLIQTFTPTHPVIQATQKHDYLPWLSTELLEREKFQFPPFTRLIQITFRHAKAEKLAADAGIFTQLLAQYLTGVRIDGPITPSVARVRNKFICHWLLRIPRAQSPSPIKQRIWYAVEVLQQQTNRSCDIQFDVDPY